MFPLHLQALRYSYFFVGQLLGTPQQIQEQGRPQPAPLQLKPLPPPQPLPQHRLPSRPLQQIQPGPSPLYQQRAEPEQEPREPASKMGEALGLPQLHLPLLHGMGGQPAAQVLPLTMLTVFTVVPLLMVVTVLCWPRVTDPTYVRETPHTVSFHKDLCAS